MSAQQEKTIQIDREFFKLSGSTKKSGGRKQTRKAASSPQDDAAKQRRKELIRSIKKARNTNPSPAAPALTALGDAMAFFAGEQEAAKKRGFRTRGRQRAAVTSDVPVVGLGEMPTALKEGSTPAVVQPTTTHASRGTEPAYGCLKNGKKPTYRQWRTRRQGVKTAPANVQAAVSPSVVHVPSATPPPPVVIENPPTMPAEFKPRKEKLEAVRQKSRTRCAKAKQVPMKVGRRTRKIGMHGDRLIIATPSKAERDTFQKSLAEIKATPMAEVNKHLIASGLSTYGGSAPDDIKRRIFEDGWLAGGAKTIDCDIAVNNVLSMEAT